MTPTQHTQDWEESLRRGFLEKFPSFLEVQLKGYGGDVDEIFDYLNSFIAKEKQLSYQEGKDSRCPSWEIKCGTDNPIEGIGIKKNAKVYRLLQKAEERGYQEGLRRVRKLIEKLLWKDVGGGYRQECGIGMATNVSYVEGQNEALNDCIATIDTLLKERVKN